MNTHEVKNKGIEALEKQLREGGRYALAAQLKRGVDDDLIQWVRGVIEDGEKVQDAVKGVLRAGLGLPEPEPQLDRIEALTRRVDEMGDAIAVIPKKLRAASVSADDVKAAEERIEQRLQEYMAYFERLLGEMRAGTVTTESLAEVESIPAPPQVDNEQVERRIGNAKKAKW